MAQNYLIYSPLAILPSLIWLLFYLREDVRPEPKKEIIKVFALGMVFALFLAGIIFGLKFFFDFLISEKIFKFAFPLIIVFLAKTLFSPAVEEITKYLPIKLRVLKSPELDEPVDVILYMITSGLGFAASENILYTISYGLDFASLEKIFFSLKIGEPQQKILLFLLGRFLTATFLHALCSGIFGFFLAFSFFSRKKIYFFSGFLAASLLHGFHNFFIMKEEIKFLAATLIFSAILLKILFERSKKIKSICKT